MENNIIRLEDVVQDDSEASGYYLRVWDEMIDEYDATWHMQAHEFLMELVPHGRMRLKSCIGLTDQRMNGALSRIREQIEILAECAAVCALNDNKEFDMKISYPIIGTSRKDYVLFNGWRLAHFEKIYELNSGYMSDYYRKTNWDFALGADGEIYHITSGYAAYDNPTKAVDDDWKFFYIVRKAIFFDTCFLQNRNQIYYIAVSHGVFLTINQLLRYPEVASGDFRFETSDGYDEYFFNFPLQPNGKVEAGVECIRELLLSFLSQDMSEEEYQTMSEKIKAEKQAKLERQRAEEQARLERQKEEEQIKERKRQENIQKERERLEAQRRAEEAEAEQREREAREQSIAKAKQRIKELEQERKDVNTELANTHGIFSGKKRQQLQNKLDSIDKEIKCLQDL